MSSVRNQGLPICSERAAGKVGRQGGTGARDKRKKAPAPPQGISQGVQSLGEIIDACSGWYLIALLNLSAIGFSFVDIFHDKANRSNLL